MPRDSQIPFPIAFCQSPLNYFKTGWLDLLTKTLGLTGIRLECEITQWAFKTLPARVHAIPAARINDGGQGWIHDLPRGLRDAFDAWR